jgi:hypothetical protein
MGPDCDPPRRILLIDWLRSTALQRIWGLLQSVSGQITHQKFKDMRQHAYTHNYACPRIHAYTHTPGHVQTLRTCHAHRYARPQIPCYDWLSTPNHPDWTRGWTHQRAREPGHARFLGAGGPYGGDFGCSVSAWGFTFLCQMFGVTPSSPRKAPPRGQTSVCTGGGAKPPLRPF